MQCVSELLGNVTVTWAGRRAMPPIVFCVATAFATEVASVHAFCHGLIAPAGLLDGSPVTPVRESTLAAANAAVSADRCASALARYRGTTSMERAAMARMATMAIALMTIVAPCDPR